MVHSGKTHHFWCEQGAGCRLPNTDAERGQLEASPDDYLWLYDDALPNFVLKACPPGHQLVNSSGGVFNAGIQKCEPCGEYERAAQMCIPVVGVQPRPRSH
jgi:hypothetical protein